LQSDVFLVHD